MTSINEAQLILQKEARRIVINVNSVAIDSTGLPTVYVKLNPDMTWHWVDRFGQKSSD